MSLRSIIVLAPAIVLLLSFVACAPVEAENVEDEGSAVSGDDGKEDKDERTCSDVYTCSTGRWILGIDASRALAGVCYRDGKPYPSGVQSRKGQRPSATQECRRDPFRTCPAKKWETCSGGKWVPDLAASKAKAGECRFGDTAKTFGRGAQLIWDADSSTPTWVEPEGPCNGDAR